MLKQIGSSTDKIISKSFPAPFVERHTQDLLLGKRQRKLAF